MTNYEVPSPILNSPYEEPKKHWVIEPNKPAVEMPGRRKAGYWYRDPAARDFSSESVRGVWQELPLVNLIRERLTAWRPLALRGEGGVSRTTMELLQYWRREGRENRLFFAQLEAAETIIFLTEARQDFLQGIDIPLDQPDERKQAEGYRAFRRYACKMATGTGKTTVMAMLAAWSILNKVHARADSRFSDIVLVVCPNVTIRNRLAELDPLHGEASLYRTRDIVPENLMPDLAKGRVLVTNWHVFEPQTVQAGGVSAKVVKSGVPTRIIETLRIGEKTTTARGSKYITLEQLQQQITAGLVTILDEVKDREGNLKAVKVESVKYIESDAHLIRRILGTDIAGKQNILVFNDEAHHAYRIRRQDSNNLEDDEEEEEELEELEKEATVWVEGLDKLHKLNGINFCVDLSATPYYLGRVGQETNKTFPWVVSEFGLTDAIESGLVKVPQLAVRDTTGNEIPGYFNIWHWILPKLTSSERGGKRANPKPEAIVKWAHAPIAMLAGLWEQLRREWEQSEDTRPPVFIIVCKNTKIAKVVYEWIAEDKCPTGIPSLGIDSMRNTNGVINTIRVDSKVVHETDTGEAKSDESRWMRLTLDTVGKQEWPKDRFGRPIYPEGFEELAKKLGRPLHPPGRDVRCIVSVGMLTEGWDCNTVTHIIGLRPFMSQLLCEQVVGRGLRRRSYDPNEDGKFSEEVAKVFGVPFEIIPFKQAEGPAPPREKRHHIFALPERKHLEIRFPRVAGYRQAIRNKITVEWDALAPLELNPLHIPPEVQVKATLPANSGRPSLLGPGKLEDVTLNPFRAGRRLQELAFDLAATLTREYCAQPSCEIPAHRLFPQALQITQRYLREKVRPIPPAETLDVFLSPYYGWVIEILREAIKPDVRAGEAPEIAFYETNRGPGSTAEVDYWTSREPVPVTRSHVNAVVPDTKTWEQSAAYYLDTHGKVEAFVKNAGLGFSIPYLHNGEMHDYVPDFLVKVSSDPPTMLIIETKGFDPLADVKRQAAERWTSAVTAEGSYGVWRYVMVKNPAEIRKVIDQS
jgi:type III restriction enzyme